MNNKVKWFDNESEAGSWKREMEKLPWGYGQTQTMKVDTALSNVRAYGLYSEADTLQQEIKTLQMELEFVRNELGKLKNDYPIDFESNYRGN